VRWCWEQSSGEGEAQGGGGLASGGPGAATYREEEIREGRKAEGHGGVEGSAAQMARAGGGRHVVARGEATGAG
jgi:hypothetical protein